VIDIEYSSWENARLFAVARSDAHENTETARDWPMSDEGHKLDAVGRVVREPMAGNCIWLAPWLHLMAH
jgi:hypothetical protein